MFRHIIKLFNNKNRNKSILSVQNHNFLCNLINKPNLTNFHTLNRNINTSTYRLAKVFVDRENAYLYGLLTLPETVNASVNVKTSQEIVSPDDFNAFIEQKWQGKTPQEIINAFETVCDYCKSNHMDLSNTKFNLLTDGLLDKVELLSDAQLLHMLDLLMEFPACESFKSHNFHDIWSALDDVCCWRISTWNNEMLFEVADKWYRLGLGKVCDFIFEILEKLSKKPKHLTKSQLIHAFFFMNVCRKRTIDFEYESAIEKILDELTLDDLAIVALGYFKSQSKIKIPEIMSVMMRKVKEAENVHEMTLCAILKVIRFTSTPALSDQITDFLNNITPTLDSQSNMCLIHCALLGTTLQILHEPSIKIAAQRIAKNAQDLSQVRLKDLERLLLPLTMFGYDPKTEPDIFKVIFDELHSEKRQREIAMYPRCMPSALLFLSIKNMYSYELMNTILDMDFINEVYGKVSKSLPREIFTLDVSAEIECPNYLGNRLDLNLRYKATKWLTEYTPTHDQRKRISNADKVVLDVTDNVLKIIRHKKFMFEGHVLPHFSKSDIVLCKNKATNQFVEPFGFENYIFGDVMRPTDMENYHWFAVVIIGWNATIRNTTIPVGSMQMKLRQLEKIGYNPVVVIWNEYMPLPHHEKLNYLINKIDFKQNNKIHNIV